MSKTIRKSNLAYRFYVCDGWTRKDVLSFIQESDLSFVIPRYDDYEKDESVMKNYSQFKITDNTSSFDDCDYFIVPSLKHQEIIVSNSENYDISYMFNLDNSFL